MSKWTRLLAVLLCVCLLFTSCAPVGNEKEEYSQEVQNLEKLCKVWGYVKYTHPVFLTGEKDWDTELIALIPQVRQAENSEATNQILNEWLLSLGEIQYEDEEPVKKWSSAKEEDKVVIADTSWIFDKKYLGEELSANMEPLTKPLPDINRFRAPIDFSRGYYTGLFEPAMFYNEKLYEDMDYSDENYRLLGLFRVWNALEYYCPYLDILDEDWEDLLPEFIPQMLAESDQQSYDLTIAALMAKLQDAHVSFWNGDFLKKEFGEYLIDEVEFVFAEGEIVIVQTFDESSLFQTGDIVRKIDGVDIKDMTFFQPFHIHCPALNGMVFHDLSCPLAELHRPLIVHFKAYGNDHLKIVVVLASADLSISLGLNCQVFLDSCLWCQLAVCIDSIDMLGNCLLGYIIQRCHHFLGQPDIFVLIPHFKASITLPGGSHESQIFCCRAANR